MFGSTPEETTNTSTFAQTLAAIRTLRTLAESEPVAQALALLSDANKTRAAAANTVVEANSGSTVARLGFRALRTLAYITAAFAVGAVVSHNATVKELAGQGYDKVRDAAPDLVTRRLPERDHDTVNDLEPAGAR